MGSGDKKRSKDSRKKESRKRHRSSSSSASSNHENDLPRGGISLSERLQNKQGKESPTQTMKSYDEFDVPLREKSIQETSKQSPEYSRKEKPRERTPEVKKKSSSNESSKRSGSKKLRHQSPEVAKSFSDEISERERSKKIRKRSPESTESSSDESPQRSSSAIEEKRERERQKRNRHHSRRKTKSSDDDGVQRVKKGRHQSPKITKSSSSSSSSSDESDKEEPSRKTRNSSPPREKPKIKDEFRRQRSKTNRSVENSPDSRSPLNKSSDDRRIRERSASLAHETKKNSSRQKESSSRAESVVEASDDDHERSKDEDKSQKPDRSRESNRSRRRDIERSRKRSRSRDSRQRSPREYDTSRSRRDFRYEGRYSRNDDRRSRNEFTGRRYWDNGRDDDRKRDRYHDSDEEQHIVGERFYGGTSRDLDRQGRRGNKENINSSNDRTNNKTKANDEDLEEGELAAIPASQKRTVDLLTSKTGGAYIPPAKLRLMQAEITDKSGAAYQRIAWEALKKSIHGHINKINTSNIGLITRELLRENIVRGRGLLARSIIQAQAASPTFTSVYAALTAVINSKFPDIGKLLLTRLVNQFKRAFRLNNKPLCISTGTFIAHLVNQNVAHEILGLELLTLLLDTPNNDSVEVSIAFLKECGMKLTEVSRKGIEAIFEMLRNILHEGNLDKRVQYMIEVMFQVRKDGFKDHEAVPTDLDLIEEEDQITHLITLDEVLDSQDILNVFKLDPDFIKNEDEYKQLSKDILDTDDSSGSDNDEEDDDSSGKEESDEEDEKKEGMIIDSTETNLIALRRTIYLTIHASLDFEECAHKLIKMQLKPGQEAELCHMFLDCCAEMRTYEKFFGLLAGRFCAINKIYITPFEQMFKDSFDTIHRLDMNKLRNVAKFFAHLLFTDSISWNVLSCIKLNEDDTTSSSRIFIKILFQELSEYMGLVKLNARVKDVTLQEAFEGLFPRDDPRNTRFAINFFTSIGLGGLTDDLREHLKNRPKPPPPPPVVKPEPSSSSESSASSSSSSSSSESSSDSSDSSSSSSSSSSSGEDRKKKKKKRKTKKRTSQKEVIEKSNSKSSKKKGSEKKKKKEKKNGR